MGEVTWKSEKARGELAVVLNDFDSFPIPDKGGRTNRMTLGAPDSVSARFECGIPRGDLGPSGSHDFV
jgi:hypothetical protein